MANKNNFDFDNVDDGPLDAEALEKLGLMFSVGIKTAGVDFENIIEELYKYNEECEDFNQFQKLENNNSLTRTIDLFYRYIKTRNVP